MGPPCIVQRGSVRHHPSPPCRPGTPSTWSPGQHDPVDGLGVGVGHRDPLGGDGHRGPFLDLGTGSRPEARILPPATTQEQANKSGGKSTSLIRYELFPGAAEQILLPYPDPGDVPTRYGIRSCLPAS